MCVFSSIIFIVSRISLKNFCSSDNSLVFLKTLPGKRLSTASITSPNSSHAFKASSFEQPESSEIISISPLIFYLV
jgi:hypothetical protein